MKRRAALKNMGLVFGYAVATPAALNLLESCKAKNTVNWAPTFFSQQEAFVIETLVDLFFPKTDTPSGTEMGVHVFIDAYANTVMRTQQETIALAKKNFLPLKGSVLLKDNKNFLQQLLQIFNNAVLKKAGKETVTELTATDFEPILKTALAPKSMADLKADSDIFNAYAATVAGGSAGGLDEKVALNVFANEIRDLITWAYKNTEYVGEQVLAYESIPGGYVPCGDLQELTKGKDWSVKS